MKFSESFRIRSVSFLFIFVVLLILPFWWIACIFEYFIKERKQTYFFILKDAYYYIFSTIVKSIVEVKNGKISWT